MTRYERIRGTMLIAGSVLVGALALAAPAPLAGNDCLSPWVDRCVASTAACTSCSTYCSNLGSDCVVEYSHCAMDENYCPPQQYYDACSCKEESGGGGGGHDPGSPE